MQQITKSSSLLVKKNIINRISDVPSGVSLVLSNLIVGNVVTEATPLSAPTDGKRTVCKQAKLLTGSTTTVFRVENGSHSFKVTDILMQAVDGAAYAITAVALAVGTVGDVVYDTLTVGTALESAAAGTFIYEGSTAGADTGALENEADTILNEAFEVPSTAQVIWPADAQVRADVVEASVGPLYLATLDVNEIKY